MTDPKKLISQLQKEFEQNSLVEAFVLVGSQARDGVYKATKYSDMEAYIITKDQNVETLEKQLPDLLKKTGKVLFSFKHVIGFVAVYDDLFRLELPVIKMSGLEGLFNRPKAQTVKVLIDRTEGKLDKTLANRPDNIDFAKDFKNRVTNFWYWQILAVQYFKKGEFYNARAVLGIHTSNLIWMYGLLNDPTILLLETNKRIEQFLTHEQLLNIKKITPAYDPKIIHNSLTQVADIFMKTSLGIKEKYGYEFDESLEAKITPRLQKLLEV